MPPNVEPQNAFEGYVVATLEGMKERLNVLPCTDQSKRIGKCENDISNMKGRATIIGAVAGFVTAWFSKYIIGK